MDDQVTDVQDAVRSTDSDHPAIDRLRQDLRADGSIDQVITSYDRMHHRHSRS